MRAPLAWIVEFTPVEAPIGDIADALNQLGLEVEGIDEPGREIGGVVVARILDILPHPDADRIRLADVDAGDGPVRVVCGARIIGVARELAAHFALPLHVPSPDPGPVVSEIEGATVVVDSPDRCPRFVAMVAGVTMGESPDWLKRRLTLAGMRPISNVVDVTNY